MLVSPVIPLVLRVHEPNVEATLTIGLYVRRNVSYFYGETLDPAAADPIATNGFSVKYSPQAQPQVVRLCLFYEENGGPRQAIPWRIGPVGVGYTVEFNTAPGEDGPTRVRGGTATISVTPPPSG